MIKYIKKHYHWIIAATLFLMMGIRGGIGNNLNGLHLVCGCRSLKPLQITGAVVDYLDLLDYLKSHPIIDIKRTASALGVSYITPSLPQ